MGGVGRGLLAVAGVLVVAVSAGCTAGAPSESPPPPAAISSATPATPPPATRDEALLRQLQADPAVVREMLLRRRPAGRFLCGIKVLGADADRSHVYAWLVCGDFTVGSKARVRSASSMPAVLRVAGSGIDIRLRRVEFRRQAHLDADTARLFPARIAHRIERRGGSIQVRPSLDELLEQARQLS